MKVGDLRNSLNFFNRNVPVLVRIGRKEYKVRNTELKYITNTLDLDDPREEQVVVVVAEEDE